jgi:hypothetical protein
MKSTNSSIGILLLLLGASGCGNGKTCALGLTTCQTSGKQVCVDTQNDSQNCGGCGQACATNQICALSSCVIGACGTSCGCPTLQSRCPGVDGGSCVNLANDPVNCGACGTACPGGHACVGGVCLGGCMVGLTTCQLSSGVDVCVDTRNDPQNCGGCGVPCTADETCTLSSCVTAGCGASCGCPSLESACPVGDGGVCVNLTSDPANCGSCGMVCPGSELCSGGRCLMSCPAGLSACGPDAGPTLCAFLPKDPVNCGQCGLQCSAGLGNCLDGKCYGVRPPALPAPRWTLAAATDLAGAVYAIGGSDEVSRNTSTVWRFTGTDAGWEAVQSLTTARGALAATAGKDGRIYAIGGSSGALTSSVAEVFDPATNHWTLLPALPTPRDWLAAATALDGRIYTFGGQLITYTTLPDGGVQASYAASSAVEVYDPSTNAWSSGPSMPTARWAHGAVVGPDGAFYVVGGQTDLTNPTDRVERLLPDGGWQTLPSLSKARSGLAAAVGPDGRIYAIGGYVHGGALDGTVDVYDVSAGTWSVAPLPLLTPRYGLAAATAPGPRGYIFALGGGLSGSVGGVVSTVEVLITDFGQWQ